jgi:hypothetical protein
MVGPTPWLPLTLRIKGANGRYPLQTIVWRLSVIRIDRIPLKTLFGTGATHLGPRNRLAQENESTPRASLQPFDNQSAVIALARLATHDDMAIAYALDVIFYFQHGRQDGDRPFS